MAGMGPAPKPADQRRRRNVKPVAMKLPAGGRVGPVPKFPIPLFDSGADSVQRQVRKLEAELWKELWRLPQAVAWEQIGYTREVAQYVRWKVRGELGELEAAKEAPRLRFEGQNDDAIELLTALYAIRIANFIRHQWRCSSCGVTFDG